MKIGFIANPEAGKDIRRIISDAFTFNNFEKLNIIKRILRVALESSETEFLFMPDSFGFGKYAQEEFGSKVNVLPFLPDGESDTKIATKLMNDADVCCIVTLGGDGTNRLVAKEAGNTPLIPVASGTNNAFPFMYDGTTIGMLLYAVSKIGILQDELDRQKRIEIYQDAEFKDIALVDAAVIESDFLGSKAVFEVEKIKELFVTFSRRDTTGLSSIFSTSMPVERNAPMGGRCEIGDGFRHVLAPILPGKLVKIGVKTLEKIPLNTPYRIKYFPSIIAVDGERTVKVNGGNFTVKVTENGPNIVNVGKVLERACKEKIFMV
jgi:predicted polyphosphate/ATP-dependent NAD kinase